MTQWKPSLGTTLHWLKVLLWKLPSGGNVKNVYPFFLWAQPQTHIWFQQSLPWAPMSLLGAWVRSYRFMRVTTKQSHWQVFTHLGGHLPHRCPEDARSPFPSQPIYCCLWILLDQTVYRCLRKVSTQILSWGTSDTQAGGDAVCKEAQLTLWIRWQFDSEDSTLKQLASPLYSDVYLHRSAFSVSYAHNQYLKHLDFNSDVPLCSIFAYELEMLPIGSQESLPLVLGLTQILSLWFLKYTQIRKHRFGCLVTTPIVLFWRKATIPIPKTCL